MIWVGWSVCVIMTVTTSLLSHNEERKWKKKSIASSFSPFFVSSSCVSLRLSRLSFISLQDETKKRAIFRTPSSVKSRGLFLSSCFNRKVSSNNHSSQGGLEWVREDSRQRSRLGLLQCFFLASSFHVCALLFADSLVFIVSRLRQTVHSEFSSMERDPYITDRLRERDRRWI